LDHRSGKDLKNEIDEIYGSLPKPILGHGRTPNSVVQITQKEALDFKKYISKRGIEFAYLLNGPAKKNIIHSKKSDEYLDWIMNEFRADSLTITSIELMKRVRQLNNSIKINVSTIAGIKNVTELVKYLEFGISKIIPHHDTNRNFSDLEILQKFCTKEKIEIELLATESCLRECPNRWRHYSAIANFKDDASFHINCNTKKINHPLNLLKANFIRPEDLKIYNNIGINRFKITGRSKPKEWITEVTQAYFAEEYSGNLVRLLGISVPNFPIIWNEIFISNKSLKGFLKNFPDNSQQEERYCLNWLEQLSKNGDFKLSEEIINEYTKTE